MSQPARTQQEWTDALENTSDEPGAGAHETWRTREPRDRTPPAPLLPVALASRARTEPLGVRGRRGRTPEVRVPGPLFSLSHRLFEVSVRVPALPKETPRDEIA